MGLLSKIFGNRKPKENKNIRNPYSTTSNYGNWHTKDLSKSQSDIIQSSINVIASHASKMKFVHSYKGKGPKDISYIERLLNTQPNPYTPSQQFIYKFVSTLFYYDNSYIYPKTNLFHGINKDVEKYKEFWPLDPYATQLMEGENNKLWLQFTFSLGQQATIEYENMIHMRNYFTDDDIIGGLKYPEMSLENITSYDLARKSIANATAMSSRVIGKLIMADSLNEEDRTASIAKFNRFLASTESESAVYPEDMNATLETIDLKPKSAASNQIKTLKADVMEHIPLNPNILNGTYSEQEYNAFYETVLEPLAVQIGQVFTNTLFTEEQQVINEDKIIMTTNMLAHASWKTKIEIVRLLNGIRGMKIGTIREMFGGEFGKDGDEYMQSLNNIAGSKADDYQAGKSGNDNNKGKGEEDVE